MQFEKGKYKVACIMGIIISSICILLCTVTIIFNSDLDSFKEMYTYYMDSLMETSPEYANMIYSYGIDLNELGRVAYVIYILIQCASMICFILCLVFALVTFKDYELDAKSFQKRNALHIWYLVSLGLCWFNSDAADASFIAAWLDISVIISIACWVAFFIALSDIRTNKRVARYLDTHGDIHDRPYYTQGDYKQPQQEEVKKEDYNIEPQGQEISVEEKPSPSVKQPEGSNEDMYELLAKLEKRYKNGEISEEDYRRMKKTILDNYLN